MNEIAVRGDSCNEISFAIVTNDGKAYPKRGVAILVQMNCEKKVASKLDKRICKLCACSVGRTSME